MRFDNKQYWENRKAGRRGQGETLQGRFTPKDGEHLVRMLEGLRMANRTASRNKRPSDPSRTKKTSSRLRRRIAIEAQRAATK
jgi:hypothetical protein